MVRTKGMVCVHLYAREHVYMHMCVFVSVKLLLVNTRPICDCLWTYAEMLVCLSLRMRTVTHPSLGFGSRVDEVTSRFH